MIYYFSGTGNSRLVAESLAGKLGQAILPITACNPEQQQVEGESIGFVFPVYSWGVPPPVLDFVAALPESFWHSVKVMQLPVWCVMTCGDETAMAPEMMDRALRRRGISLRSIWSVQMPNNYVLLPGFDVDPAELEKSKLEKCEPRIAGIARGILQDINTVDVVRGSWPRLKTKAVYPFFKRWGIKYTKWHCTDACIGCGQCADACPVKNITMKNGRPVWGDRCVSCLACYHVCPVNAVRYGNATDKKGQYSSLLRLFRKKK